MRVWGVDLEADTGHTNHRVRVHHCIWTTSYYNNLAVFPLILLPPFSFSFKTVL